MSNISDKSRYWLEIVLFIFLGILSIGLPLVPMGLAANSMPFPDLMFTLFAAWVVRHPSTAPMLVIVFIAVLADALLMRPFGLGALVTFVGMEVLRHNGKSFREIPFLLEWIYISALFAVILLVQNLLLFISFDDVYGLKDTVWHFARTVAVYPVVVAILHWGLRIRTIRKDNRPNRLGYVL